MSTTRREFLIRASATALVAASGLASLPAAMAASSSPDAVAPRTFRVRPDEVHALMARLEGQTGGPVATRGNQLFLRTPDGPRAARLELIL